MSIAPPPPLPHTAIDITLSLSTSPPPSPSSPPSLPPPAQGMAVDFKPTLLIPLPQATPIVTSSSSPQQLGSPTSPTCTAASTILFNFLGPIFPRDSMAVPIHTVSKSPVVSSAVFIAWRLLAFLVCACSVIIAGIQIQFPAKKAYVAVGQALCIAALVSLLQMARMFQSPRTFADECGRARSRTTPRERSVTSFEVLLLHAAPIIVVVHGLVGTMYAHAKLDGSSVGAYFRSAAFAVVAPVLFVHVVDLLITATPSCLLCILSTTILTNLLSIAIVVKQETWFVVAYLLITTGLSIVLALMLHVGRRAQELHPPTQQNSQGDIVRDIITRDQPKGFPLPIIV